MNDLVNIELANDNLKQFDESWENVFVALENEPANDVLEGRHLRVLVKPTFMYNAFALNHSDLTHRKEPKSYIKKYYGRRFVEKSSKIPS